MVVTVEVKLKVTISFVLPRIMKIMAFCTILCGHIYLLCLKVLFIEINHNDKNDGINKIEIFRGKIYKCTDVSISEGSWQILISMIRSTSFVL